MGVRKILGVKEKGDVYEDWYIYGVSQRGLGMGVRRESEGGGMRGWKEV